MTDNYFEFYDIPIRFSIDEKELKRKYYEKSRELHPDYHTLSSDSQQEQMLTMSAYNNDAYLTLKNQDKRIEYILTLHGLLGGDTTQEMDQSFLMEMMDVNESLMEIQMSPDPVMITKIKEDINTKESELMYIAQQSMDRYDDTRDEDLLESILQYYLKKKYLLRIRDNLNSFDLL